MIAKLRLLRWSDRDARQLAVAMDRCWCGAASRCESFSDGRSLVLPTVPDLVERARAIHFQRKARRAPFGQEAALFQEPAWDILLELYIFGADGPGLASTSIAYAIDVPITTTLRWIRSLEKRGLVVSTIDRVDARIRRVVLTPRALESMANYLSGI